MERMQRARDYNTTQCRAHGLAHDGARGVAAFAPSGGAATKEDDDGMQLYHIGIEMDDIGCPPPYQPDVAAVGVPLPSYGTADGGTPRAHWGGVNEPDDEERRGDPACDANEATTRQSSRKQPLWKRVLNSRITISVSLE